MWTIITIATVLAVEAVLHARAVAREENDRAAIDR